jgi:hypothetical protein
VSLYTRGKFGIWYTASSIWVERSELLLAETIDGLRLSERLDSITSTLFKVFGKEVGDNLNRAG